MSPARHQLQHRTQSQYMPTDEQFETEPRRWLFCWKANFLPPSAPVSPLPRRWNAEDWAMVRMQNAASHQADRGGDGDMIQELCRCRRQDLSLGANNIERYILATRIF